jgi:hypothetical protein
MPPVAIVELPPVALPLVLPPALEAPPDDELLVTPCPS